MVKEGRRTCILTTGAGPDTFTALFDGVPVSPTAPHFMPTCPPPPPGATFHRKGGAAGGSEVIIRLEKTPQNNFLCNFPDD